VRFPRSLRAKNFSRELAPRKDDFHLSFPEVGGESPSLPPSLPPLLTISYRSAPPRFVVGDDIFPSYLATEPGSSLRHRRSQDRVRGERRGRLVEQVRLRRGPSSGINGRWRERERERCDEVEDQRRESKRKRGSEREKEKRMGERREEAARKNNDKVI
jgi:hypothetical protein